MKEINTKTLQVTQDMFSQIRKIDGFNEVWSRQVGHLTERLRDWKRLATIESIGSSTRIEGSQMTDHEVEEYLANLKIQDFATRDKQEVAGYANVMETILESWKDIPITENYIKQLHRDLLFKSQKDERHRGEYKKHPNHVVAFDQNGREVGIVFKTVTPFETPSRMTDLVKWYSDEANKSNFHPLVKIAVFKLMFLAIHPFQDGNGRLSRLLVILMLLQAGYQYVPYSSFESVIESTKADYYRALRTSQVTLESDSPNWQPWMEYFFRTLLRQIKLLEEKIDFEMRIKEYGFSQLASTILFYAHKKPYVTNRHLVDVTGVSRNTIKKMIQGLVKKGFLVKRGAGRSTIYELVKEKL